MGVNLEGKMAYAWLQLQAGATIQRSRYKEAVTWSETNPDLPAQKKMFRTPDVYGYFTSTFTPVKRLAISFTGTYTGTMLVQHLAGYIPEDREEKTPDFFDLNMKVAYDFPLYKSVTLPIRVISIKARTVTPNISTVPECRAVILWGVKSAIKR